MKKIIHSDEIMNRQGNVRVAEEIQKMFERASVEDQRDYLEWRKGKKNILIELHERAVNVDTKDADTANLSRTLLSYTHIKPPTTKHVDLNVETPIWADNPERHREELRKLIEEVKNAK